MEFIEGFVDRNANICPDNEKAPDADAVDRDAVQSEKAGCDKGDGLGSEKVNGVHPVDIGVQHVGGEDLHVDVGVQDENVDVGVVGTRHGVQTTDVDGHVAYEDLHLDVGVKDGVVDKGNGFETRDADGVQLSEGHDEEPVVSFNVEQSHCLQPIHEDNLIEVAKKVSLPELFQEVHCLKTKLQSIEKRELCLVTPAVGAEFEHLRNRLQKIETILNIKSKFEFLPHQSIVVSKHSEATDNNSQHKALVSHLPPQSETCSKESDVKGISDSDYYDSMVSTQVFMLNVVYNHAIQW